MNIIGYDTETWSSNQISKGLEHYFSASDFEIICAGFAIASGPVQVDGSIEPEAVVPHGTTSIYAAHNMHFDRSAVTAHAGWSAVPLWFDTMIGVRAILGASLGRNAYISLDKSAKLLLPKEYHKDQRGAELMPYFSFPSSHNNYGKTPWRAMRAKYPAMWEEYLHYCGQDAMVAYQLAMLTREHLGDEAFDRLVKEAEITYQMNQRGWPVDRPLLDAMLDRAQENTEQSLTSLVETYNPGFSSVHKRTGAEVFKPLNLNSGVQLKKWLGERGHVIENTQADTITELIDEVEDELASAPTAADAEVLAVLQAKVDLGGATLKKLQPIINGLSKDGRLRGMYNHIAAASTHRTTGSGVQMQNLKRLPDEVEDLTAEGIATMNNNELARNIRQLFKAEDDGEIVVADLKSIEGLLVGWVFGVDWMVEAVRDGKDMYKMSAAERFRVAYDSVTPEQRRQAKTGVLAGNYGGGKGAYVKTSLGALTEDEAQQDVRAYRETVPNLVQGWWDLNDMLIEAVESGSGSVRLHNGFVVVADVVDAGVVGDTLVVTLMHQGQPVFTRFWHCIRLDEDDQGRKEVTYAVADERKTAPSPWKYANSEGQPFKLYGGKLTGTLIQSLARELYFYQLGILSELSQDVEFSIIGQLHDEVVCEWNSNMKSTLGEVEATIEKALTKVPWYLSGCPVRVKVSHAPRYIK